MIFKIWQTFKLIMHHISSHIPFGEVEAMPSSGNYHLPEVRAKPPSLWTALPLRLVMSTKDAAALTMMRHELLGLSIAVLSAVLMLGTASASAQSMTEALASAYATNPDL
ncbi:hypothetical protein FFK22_029000, partial [Mycobacterium sp. KBS0706]|uniref:hypothetical protein n=1 Tax=Mycobacterium sp. KBS0706 TaxID=2578109 RepID=UPI0011814B56